jgi:hypothetical protein
LTRFPSRPVTTTRCGTGSGWDRRHAESRSQKVVRRFLVAGFMVYPELEDELPLDDDDADADEARFASEVRADCWPCSLDRDSSMA